MQHQITQLEPIRQPAMVLFWLAFYGLGALVLLISLGSFGKASPIAILLQCAAGTWILAALLRMLHSKLTYAFAATWVLLLAVPMAVQVVRRLHHWVTVGMEPADGMGSPLAFLIGFVFEWAIFAPLCFMFAALIIVRPWHAGRPAGGA